jgi:hypothetical protein
MGLRSSGWADGPGGRPVADGPWRTALGGRPVADGPGRGVRQTVRQAVRPAVRQPADRHPDRRTERPSAIQPMVGAGDQRLGGWPSAMPSAGWGGGRHAVRRTSVGLSDAVATQDRVFPHYVPNSSIKNSKSDSKDCSQEIL